jgi:predicted transglutaminase-like cysteine proteinase
VPEVTHDELVAVNKAINATPYVAEVGDDWAPITDMGGDCDSYATAKMQALYKIGWPLSAMRLATCWTETGEYHAVLLVDFDGTTFVMDNRRPYPTSHDLLPYKWDKFQIAGTQQWEMAKND